MDKNIDNIIDDNDNNNDNKNDNMNDNKIWNRYEVFGDRYRRTRFMWRNSLSWYIDFLIWIASSKLFNL